MGDAEQIYLLRQGSDVWNQWRKADHLVNLSGVDLSMMDLSDMNLSGANLIGASLIGATLFGTNLSRTNLSRAHFHLAKLNMTVFGDTNLTDAIGLDGCYHHGPSILDYLTLSQSGRLPDGFLRGCGLPQNFIAYLPSLLNQPIQFYSCFISYSHADKPFAKLLHDTLQGRGIRCWLDERQLLPGDDIYEQVDRGIRHWDKVLLCCSSTQRARHQGRLELASSCGGPPIKESAGRSAPTRPAPPAASPRRESRIGGTRGSHFRRPARNQQPL